MKCIEVTKFSSHNETPLCYSKCYEHFLRYQAFIYLILFACKHIEIESCIETKVDTL